MIAMETWIVDLENETQRDISKPDENDVKIESLIEMLEELQIEIMKNELS